MAADLVRLATTTDDVTLKLTGRAYAALCETGFEWQGVLKLPMKKMLPPINGVLRDTLELFQ